MRVFFNVLYRDLFRTLAANRREDRHLIQRLIGIVHGLNLISSSTVTAEPRTFLSSGQSLNIMGAQY